VSCSGATFLEALLGPLLGLCSASRRGTSLPKPPVAISGHECYVLVISDVCVDVLGVLGSTGKALQHYLVTQI
jgi:hypothetical protein